jgi:hypothetical protein
MVVMIQIAEAGFMYLPISNSKDHTLCPYCEVSLEGWEEDDNVVYEHKKRNPECAYFKIQTEELNAAPVKKKNSNKSISSPKRPAADVEGSNVRKKGKVEEAPKVEEEEVVEEGETFPLLKKGRKVVSAKAKEAFEFLDDFGADQWPNDESGDEFLISKSKKPIVKKAIQNKSRSRSTKSKPVPKTEVITKRTDSKPDSTQPRVVVPYSDSDDVESAPKIAVAPTKAKAGKLTKKGKATANSKGSKKKPASSIKTPEVADSDGETVTDDEPSQEVMNDKITEQDKSSTEIEKVSAPASEVEVVQPQRARGRKRMVAKKVKEIPEPPVDEISENSEKRLSAVVIEVPKLTESNVEVKETKTRRKAKKPEVKEVESETSDETTIPEAVTPNEESPAGTPVKSVESNSLFDKLLIHSTISTKSLMLLYESNKHLNVKAFLELLGATALERLDAALTSEIEQLSQK